MKKLGIIEVGSTNTKGYIFLNGEIIEKPMANIEFKKHYSEYNRLIDEDKNLLFNYVIGIKSECEKVYVCGTSVFRALSLEEKTLFLKEFLENTGVKFEIISAEKENEYTVRGALTNVKYNGNIAVMIGGGGSTEIAICRDGKVLEIANSSFGGADTFERFPDMNEQYATSDREDLTSFIKSNLILPKLKADILILAGGNFILSAESAKYPVSKNILFESKIHPYMIGAKEKNEYDLTFYYKINLDDMRKYTPETPKWWNGSRAMQGFVKVVSDAVGAKYVLPTSINMVYGIVAELSKTGGTK